MKQSVIMSEISLKGATLETISEVASEAIYSHEKKGPLLSVKDVSGNSGAKTFICKEGNSPRCIVKVSGDESIMNSHPNTIARVTAATEAMRKQGIAPPILMKGSDFHIEASAGISVMQDFFHFDPKLAPADKLAALLAKVHSTPIDWYTPLKKTFLERDPALGAILRSIPPYSPGWCLPWSGFDTGMPVLGVGNPNPVTARKILDLEMTTGVYKKIMQCSAFDPVSSAARRQVVVHNDFKPDNVLHDPETGTLAAIDYDLVQVGAAVMDFGLPYTMWLGARYTTFGFRQAFIKSYLEASNLSASDGNVREMMIDCEVNTIVAFPGLLAKIYDAEVPLLRGIKHPTTKEGYQASGKNVSPTGLELVDLLADAVRKVRSDQELIDRCLHEGLVATMFKTGGFGCESLNSWLKEMQKNNMLRLFGIAETDGGELYVAKHARN